MLRPAFAAAVAAALLGSIPSLADAATVTRETLERQMLDSCIYRQYRVKDIDRQSMVDKCRCASRTAISTMPGESFEQPRSGGLTGPQTKAVDTGIAACFKS